ncbi:hypothetical protein F2P81_004110 [Scophthalmus maximus]|uniref:Uncharacterized protein n=1 Tax=Scophthalmus maximus TaxID=52904 RepID=A0A6A4T9M0_SCOMX|nr:hypothetical protein F2P81_004110 [Scophthalmus maximus]
MCGQREASGVLVPSNSSSLHQDFQTSSDIFKSKRLRCELATHLHSIRSPRPAAPAAPLRLNFLSRHTEQPHDRPSNTLDRMWDTWDVCSLLFQTMFYLAIERNGKKLTK